ncbi:uncharacterized protein LOC135491161 [Lineus longissimus]|uniref:uncharacterized protein LOC135491161 n=1 Tax=Lineus longissimus TaxID=88925 RepID=UPI00315CEC2F
MDNTRPKTRGNKARDAGKKGKKGTRKRSSEQGDGQRGAKRTKRDQPADNVGIGNQDMTQTCKDMMANMNLMMTNMNKFFATKALSQDPVTIEDTDAAGEVAGAEANEASEDTGLFSKNNAVTDMGKAHLSSSFTSVALALDAHVKIEHKEKIWANVDIAKLLNPASQKKQSFKVNGTGTDGDETLTFSFGVPKVKITSFSQWQSAFAIFQSIYLDKFPAVSKQLLSYEASVKDLMVRGGDWMFYDEGFHRNMGVNPRQWDEPLWELWVRAIHQKRNNPAQINQQPFRQGKKGLLGASTRKFPAGTCWRYNGGRPCPGCNFPHKCSDCGGTHLATRCAGQTRSTSNPTCQPQLQSSPTSSGRPKSIVTPPNGPMRSNQPPNAKPAANAH